jgi:hypothetical protein
MLVNPKIKCTISKAADPNIMAVALRPLRSISHPKNGVKNKVPTGNNEVIRPLWIAVNPNLSAKKSGAKARNGNTAL